ncbi:MAG: gluconate 2-dehydrogenase subunit 3 family protein [Cyclobacteriaceae bacterium]|nr:gluconate 2-dehydrogenase subunit 3 family protein [Cyclobacteriaceae bacterium]
MDRREALSTMGLIAGALAITTESFLTSCATVDPNAYQGLLDARQLAFLNDLGEAILPKTESLPGAAEANVAGFINVMVTEYFREEEQQSFVQGIDAIEEKCKADFGKKFTKMDPSQVLQLLRGLEEEANGFNVAIDPSLARDQVVYHPYTVMKRMITWGYRTSEIVAKTAFQYVPVPGRYEGCIPYAPGDKPMF